MSSPIPKPWEAIDPKPLPDTEAALLDSVLDYAAQIAAGEKQLDAVSMQKAEDLERLYQSQEWVQEWMNARPPKPDAVGRPVEPSSRNRFAQWIDWRAEKSRRESLKSSRVYQLLKAREVASYFHRGGNKYTERTIRPLAWLVSRGYPQGILEVEARAQELAAGGQVTDRIMSKALSEWKSEHLGVTGVKKANQEAKARGYRPKAEEYFTKLLHDSPEQAMDFLEWAAKEWESATTPADGGASLRAVS